MEIEKYMTVIERKAQAKSYLGKQVRIEIDRPIGALHPKHNHIIYPINYGFIPGVLGGDNEELDVYLLGVDQVVTSYDVRVIAIIHRLNDQEDKLVAAPMDMEFSLEEIYAMTNFQEQFYNINIEVPGLYDFTVKSEIKDGWSYDKKYYAKNKFNDQYFVRESSTKSLNYHRNLHDYFYQMDKLNINLARLVHIDYESDVTRSIYAWKDGIMANEYLLSASDDEAQSLGKQAGEYLKNIHSLAGYSELSWSDKFNKKIDRNISNYQALDDKFLEGELFVKYIEDNRHLLCDVKQTFMHGDYHTGNMLVADDELIIIDFDRYDIGHPWEEFNRIVWDSKVSPIFASSMLNNYFDNDIPIDFWKLLLLYISSNTLSAHTWALNYGAEDVEVMASQRKDVLDWYDNLNKIVPNWYIKTA